MTKKIIIQDFDKKHKGIAEDQLPNDSQIRIEIGKNRYTIYIEDDSVMVYKTTEGLIDSIKIIPVISNVILIS